MKIMEHNSYTLLNRKQLFRKHRRLQSNNKSQKQKTKVIWDHSQGHHCVTTVSLQVSPEGPASVPGHRHQRNQTMSFMSTNHKFEKRRQEKERKLYLIVGGLYNIMCQHFICQARFNQCCSYTLYIVHREQGDSTEMKILFNSLGMPLAYFHSLNMRLSSSSVNLTAHSAFCQHSSEILTK